MPTSLRRSFFASTSDGTISLQVAFITTARLTACFHCICNVWHITIETRWWHSHQFMNILMIIIIIVRSKHFRFNKWKDYFTCFDKNGGWSVDSIMKLTKCAWCNSSKHRIKSNQKEVTNQDERIRTQSTRKINENIKLSTPTILAMLCSHRQTTDADKLYVY